MSAPPTVGPTVTRPSVGVSLSEGSKVERWGDDVTSAADGALREPGVGRLEGLRHTLDLLFSAHSQCGTELPLMGLNSA